MTSLVAAALLAIAPLASSFCPLACECNEEVLSVSCTSSGLEVLPITLNPGIQRLQLQRNSIRAVDAALGFYAQLQYIDLSHNQLISLPDRGFIQQKKLVELRLSNNKIFKVSNGTFAGLRTVTILSLRRNFLEELGGRVFADLHRVEELDLGQNRLRALDAEAFAGLAHLRVLYLDDNDLAEVPTPTLAPLPHLAELSLANNNIQALPPRAFAPIANLYSLDLHDCRIANLSLAAFAGVESLRVLRLSGNSLPALPSPHLRGLERLEELSLGGNPIEAIPAQALPGLRKLRALDLSSSPLLALVQAGAFAHLSSLAWLSLSGCPGLRVEEGALQHLTSLHTLHLAHLGWPSVDRELVQWQHLSSVDLSGNPLHCDCQLAWLRQVLAATANTSRAECGAPPPLAGKAVAEVPAGRLRCGGRAAAEQTVLAGVCVLAGLATALLIVAAVHCQRRLCLRWLPCGGGAECCGGGGAQCCGGGGGPQCCDTDSCEKYRGALTSPGGSPLDHTLQYGPGLEGGLQYPPALQYPAIGLEGGLQELQYPSTGLEGLQYPSPPLEGGYCPGRRDQELYYPSSTKSTYCEDDFFLTLSNDRKTFKPVRVCEI